MKYQFLSVLILIAFLLLGDIAVRYVSALQTPTVPKVVTAQEFRLVDKEGKLLADLSAPYDGATADLVFYDKLGKKQMEMNTVFDGSSLNIYGKEGKLRARLAVNSSPDSPNMTIFDEKATARAVLGLDKASDPSLMLSDSNGQPRANLFLSSPQANLAFANQDGVYQALFGLGPSGKPYSEFRDPSGNTVWSATPGQHRK